MKDNTSKDHNKENDNHMGNPDDNVQPKQDGSYFDQLIGNTVTIYRGGPESKSGKLLNVQSDYMTLYTSDKAVIYYQSGHIKSISEDIKSNSTQYFLEENEIVEHISEKTFNGLLSKLENEVIQINQGGPECSRGTLLAVRTDFLILLTEEDGAVCVNLHHIKSVSKTEKLEDNTERLEDNTEKIEDNTEKLEDNTERLEVNTDEKETSKYPVYSTATNFSDVFKELECKWVTINRGGPEAMEGVLVGKSGDFYTLISDQAVLRIDPFHIRSLSSGPRGSMKQNNDENKDGSTENTEKQNSKDKNKDSNENNAKQTSKDKNKDSKENAAKQNSKDKNKDGKENNAKQNSKDKNKNKKEK